MWQYWNQQRKKQFNPLIKAIGGIYLGSMPRITNGELVKVYKEVSYKKPLRINDITNSKSWYPHKSGSLKIGSSKAWFCYQKQTHPHHIAQYTFWIRQISSKVGICQNVAHQNECSALSEDSIVSSYFTGKGLKYQSRKGTNYYRFSTDVPHAQRTINSYAYFK